jgi:uncharacterized glyoxalase superfamily protein PhnB
MTQPRTQPESFRARSLGASLTVKDVNASLAWYTNAIGFVIDQKFEHEGQVRGAALKAGDVRIIINQDDGAKGADRIKGQGFSLQFTTAQDIDQIAKRVRDAGVTLDMEPADMPWGARIFVLRDPDGYKLVVSSERKPV